MVRETGDSRKGNSRSLRARSQSSDRRWWNRTRLIWVGVLGVGMAIAGAGLFAAALLGGTAKGTTFAEMAPDITLATTDGEFVLSQQRGRVLLLYSSFPGRPTCWLEAPALGMIQSEYGDQDVTVVAVNIEPHSPLEKWVAFWKSARAGDVLWAQDTNGSTVKDYRLVALGTEVIIDRQGSVAFRSNGPAGYKKLRSEVEKVL